MSGAAIAQSVSRRAYGVEGQGSIPGRGKIFYSTPQRTDRLWIPPSLLADGYTLLFPRGYSGWGLKLSTHLYLVPRS
jgi:hypothetical protein